MRVELSHIGLCVADLERARRFYCQGLGFTEESTLSVQGEPAASLLQLPDVDLQAVFLQRDGVRLELLYYRRPEAVPSVVPRPMNVAGLTHLSFRVADVDATVAALVSLGGTVIPSSRVELPDVGVVAVFVLDPDGTRIELVRGLA